MVDGGRGIAPGLWFGGFLTVALSMVAGACAADGTLKLGVLNDQSGPFAALAGKGSVIAAEFAIADVGGMTGGRTIELINADHQNKLDLAKKIIKKWFDEDGVDTVIDVTNSSIALAAQEIARERKKTLLINSSASTEITGKYCSPYTVHWADDTYGVVNGTATTVIKNGDKDWYFITADYSYGRSIQDETARVIGRNNGTVVGDSKHPLGLLDFGALLVRAQSSGAQVVALASAGTDTVQAIRQASEYGLTENGQKLVTLMVYITDVHEATPELAQNLIVTEGFYWDQNDQSRSFARRFYEKTKTMPSKAQASVYASLRHYFKAIDAVQSIDAQTVNAKMRDMPADYFGHPAFIRADGRVVYDLTLYRVKSPSAVKYPWDYYEKVSTIPAKTAFKPEEGGGCPLHPLTIRD